jgi:hypothetical protein
MQECNPSARRSFIRQGRHHAKNRGAASSFRLLVMANALNSTNSPPRYSASEILHTIRASVYRSRSALPVILTV